MKQQYGMGRIPSPEDGRDYLMADAVRELEKAELPRPVKRWSSKVILDQGAHPWCVGYSWAGWGISAPQEDPWTDLMGRSIYVKCKILDGEPGAQNGSTVRTGAKVVQKMGRIATYFFARSVDEALDYVARFGPVVFGTGFTASMQSPSLIRNIITPRGKYIGGHAYDVVGVDEQFALIKNSWGLSWGEQGYARIRIANLRAIFADNGEACAATEKPLPIGGTR